MRVKYSALCPVCENDLSLEEISRGFCERGESLCVEDERFMDFVSFFRKAVGEPKALQRMWAKRILNGESFAAVAPTGIGKTSFGVAISLFLANEGNRCYILLPTTILVEQVVNSLSKYAENARIGVSLNRNDARLKIAFYHGRLRKDEKESFFSSLKSANILITTTQFLAKHFDDIKDLLFDFIFVDDVDAILKASKNIDRVLHLLGFREEGRIRGRGCLMVSTATAKKGRKAELFRKLLNFNIGSSFLGVRNIEDIAVSSDVSELEKILKKMGKGGLIFTRSLSEAENIYKFLKKEFRIGIGNKKKDFERFRNSELDYLIGAAHYYGFLVRGLDLPEKIRYAVFVGCPVFRIRFDDIGDPSKVGDGVVKLLFMLLKEKIPGFESENLKQDKNEIRKVLRKLLKSAKSPEDIVLRENELIIPDIRTYIQASGRTSRLHAGGITKGVSFILEEDREVMDAFIRRASYFDIDVATRSIEEIDFERLRREVDESRKRFGRRAEFDLIRPALFIVESPTKARQISRFFGRPSLRFMHGLVIYEVPTSESVLLITSCLGHVTDLITNHGFHGVEILDSNFVPVFSSIKRCQDCGYQFTLESERCPRCGSEEINDSKRLVKALRKLAYEVERIIIGTDPDTEGEKIAWDLKNLLSGCGEIRRAEFHEVTKKAVTHALLNPREVDENLVKAQIVRRVEDRWIGFALSKKLQEVFKDKNLSAGRAQSPVLGWILQRTRDSRQKKFIARIEDFDLVLDLDWCSEEGERDVELQIELIEDFITEKTPLPPYTTDAMLRDANRILRLNAAKTMMIAQELFENGLITYHRTDSTRVSEAGLRIAKEYLGNDFFPREWTQEGAHECIRPTRPLGRSSLERLIYEGIIRAEGLGRIHLSLYDLIFRRFMASQCRNFKARIARYRIRFQNQIIDEERALSAEGKAFELYKSFPLRKELPVGRFVVRARFSKVPKVIPYSEAEVVNLMRSKGIGRPSTYATILERLFTRGYVVERNGRVIGTRKGFAVYDFLVRNYPELVSEERTRILEEKMDRIARGELGYTEALKELYEEIKRV